MVVLDGELDALIERRWKNPYLAGDIRPRGLTAQEQADLIEFMNALTGAIDPEVGRPPVLPK